VGSVFWTRQIHVYKNQLSRQTGSRNQLGPKSLPMIWHTYMKLVTKYQISAINICWEKCDEKCVYMFNVYKNQLSRQTESWNLTGPKNATHNIANLVGYYTHWTYKHIFLSNYWWQKSGIWSQASYRYPISWEAFFDLSDSYFLFAEEQGYHKWALAHSSSYYILATNLITVHVIFLPKCR
jgi:hypothetical protein